MADEITITGGGSVAVATDELYRLAQCLEVVRDYAWEGKRELFRLPQPGVDAAVGVLPASVGWSLSVLVDELNHVETISAENAFALRVSSEAYGFSERVVTSTIEA